MEKRERVNKQTSVTQSKANSRTGGKEPICTNAHFTVTSMEEVTCIYKWVLVRVNAETSFSHTVFQQELQYHDEQVFK